MVTWIFQGNPKVFQVDKYLAQKKIILWTIRQKHFKDEISIGDEVFIWRADGNIPKSGGIVAKGKVISTPQNMEDDAPNLWIDLQKSTSALRVAIELEDVRLTGEGMLKRIDLEKDTNVRDMRILVVRSETNYKLEPRHAQYIEKLWKQTK
jgi:hypothetical protein